MTHAGSEAAGRAARGGAARVGHNRDPHLRCASCPEPATHAVTRPDGTALTTSCSRHADVWVGRLSD
ncbi:MAG: hypothetical protein FWE15_25500 [Actinomycetia bacterium]|nr:hypothetical protein [Actinomycetes bacterium]MCL2733356.1 hypothetical protein [Actinomycetes bacterium]